MNWPENDDLLVIFNTKSLSWSRHIVNSASVAMTKRVHRRRSTKCNAGRDARVFDTDTLYNIVLRVQTCQT